MTDLLLRSAHFGVVVFAIGTLVLAVGTWFWSGRMDADDVVRGAAVERGRDMTATAFGLAALFNLVDALSNERMRDHWAFMTPRVIVGCCFMAATWYWFFAERQRHRSSGQSETSPP